MRSGSFDRRYRRNSRALGAPSPATTYATSRCSAPSPLNSTTASSTPPCDTRTVSISPKSIRIPRSFTSPSTRPRYSISPSLRHRPISAHIDLPPYSHRNRIPIFIQHVHLRVADRLADRHRRADIFFSHLVPGHVRRHLRRTVNVQ